jgi:hypothetical protein
MGLGHVPGRGRTPTIKIKILKNSYIGGI